MHAPSSSVEPSAGSCILRRPFEADFWFFNVTLWEKGVFVSDFSASQIVSVIWMLDEDEAFNVKIFRPVD